MAGLTEIRLLSANGIPKLRAKAKHHLKLKGKGHEVCFHNSSPKLLLTILVLRRLQTTLLLPTLARRSLPQSQVPGRASDGRENRTQETHTNDENGMDQ